MTSHNKPTNVNVLNCVHRGISRLRAEELLLAAKQDGSFLIRESESIASAYTLCILFEKRVHQYRILPDSDGKLAIQSEAGVVCRKYADLNTLIHEYMQRGTKNGMAGPLLYPVPTDSASDDEDSADEEKVEEEGDGSQFEVVPATCGTMFDGKEAQNNFNEFLYQYFLQRFRSLNLSRCDGPFINILQNYTEVGANLDAQTAASGGENLTHLRHVLDEAVKDIDKQLENLMVKIDICRQLFGPITTAPLVGADKAVPSRADVTSAFDKMSRCKSAVQNLEKKAKLKFTDLAAMWKEGGVQMVDGTRQPLGRIPVKPVIPATSFEAKVMTRGGQSKIKLTVDIQSGKLMAIKPNKDCINEKNMFTHERIEQLIMSTSNNCRLDVRVTGVGTRTYLFEDMRQRENFCQLVQQLKNMHSVQPETKKISFFIGTWNMGDEMPMYSLLQWIKSDGLGKKRISTLALIPHDIYVFGTQESVLSDKEWTNRLKILLTETFGEEFYQVALATLWGIRLVIFAKLEHKNKISHVQQSTVKTGLANALGNKGAVGVSFNFSRTSFCFICAHLTSGHEKNKRRNQNFRDILKGLDLTPKKLGPFDMTKHFHHLFFFGDLNYRIEELDSLTIIKKIKESTTYTDLLGYDQLRRMQQSKEAFAEFREEEITFPPTYRFKKGTRDKYVWQKFKTTGTRINAPSYCDRILWLSYPEVPIVNTSYGCTDRICSSDHKPVFATFDVGVMTQFTSAKGGNALSGDMKIIFEEINAEVKTSKPDNFKIEFHSPCLEAPVSTKQNNLFEEKKENFCCPKWSSAQCPQLQPIFDDRDYLEDQHLLVAVKTLDGLESYGECVLALKSMFATRPQKFCCPLTHLGEETGYIRGLMHVKAKENSPSAILNQKSNKIYDLIYTDIECLKDESDPSVIYQETRPDVLNVTPHQAPQPVKFSADTLPPGAACGGGSGALLGATSTPCLANFNEGVLRPAKAMADLSRDDSCAYAEVPSSGPPNLPPRKVRQIGMPASPKLVGPAESGLTSPGLGSGLADPSSPHAIQRSGSVRSSDVGLSSSPKSQGKSVQNERASALANKVYANIDPISVRERLPLPLPEPQPTEKTLKKSEPIASKTHFPTSVQEWLGSLGLPQYINVFLHNGWDHVDFVTDMTAEDLIMLNISNADHQSRILQGIKKLKEH